MSVGVQRERRPGVAQDAGQGFHVHARRQSEVAGTLKVCRTVYRETGSGLTDGETKTSAGTRKIVLPASTMQVLGAVICSVGLLAIRCACCAAFSVPWSVVWMRRTVLLARQSLSFS